MCKISCKHELNNGESKKELACVCVSVFFIAHVFKNMRLAQIHSADNLCFSFSFPFLKAFFRSWLGIQYVCLCIFRFFFYPQNLSQCNINVCQYVCECVYVFVVFSGVDLHPGKKEERLNNQ